MMVAQKNKNYIDLGLLSTYRGCIMGIAALLVMFHHLTFKPDGSIFADAYMFVRHLGAMGVDIFLFVSGFGLSFSLSKDNNATNFYKKRIARIIPSYVVIMVLYYIISALLFGKFNVTNFLLEIFTVRFWIDGGGFWYVSAAVLLYILFPVLYKCISARGGYTRHS